MQRRFNGKEVTNLEGQVPQTFVLFQCLTQPIELQMQVVSLHTSVVKQT